MRKKLSLQRTEGRRRRRALKALKRVLRRHPEVQETFRATYPLSEASLGALGLLPLKGALKHCPGVLVLLEGLLAREDVDEVFRAHKLPLGVFLFRGPERPLVLKRGYPTHGAIHEVYWILREEPLELTLVLSPRELREFAASFLPRETLGGLPFPWVRSLLREGS